MNYITVICRCTAIVAALLCWVQPAQAGPEYDQDSWRDMIDDDCMHFYDGCNSCSRTSGGEAVCTRKACAQYSEPRCLDEDSAEAGSAEAGTNPTVQYVCNDGSDFVVRFERQETNESQGLTALDQVTLTDTRKHSSYLLTRVRSASGEKYSNGEWTFWSRGKEAMVLQDGEIVYSECEIDSEQ